MHASRQSDADDGGRHEIARCWNVEVARIPVDDAEDTGKACCLYFRFEKLYRVDKGIAGKGNIREV